MSKETTKQVKEELKEEEVEELATELPAEEEPKTEVAVSEQAPIEEKPAEEEVAEEVKPKKKKKEEEIVEERFYTIPLGKALVRPPKKRAPRAMQLIKIFVTKHMKLEIKVSEEEEEEEMPQLVVSKEVNEKVWERGIEKPPRKIKVRTTKDKDGNVTVYLAETQ
ncbi:MAG TPA: 50S ribosomal protein L31e [Candidatus Binatia bacterium]|nr:50S ribosomal protein L31e [Candidatus Binatia bacterium]